MNEETTPDRLTELSERELDDIAGGGTDVDGIDVVVKKKGGRLTPVPPAQGPTTV